MASFAGYAQNRSFEAATVFANAVKRVLVRKDAIQPRITFTLDEVTILLRLPDPKKRLGFRDQILLNYPSSGIGRNYAPLQEVVHCALRTADDFRRF